MRSDFPLTPRGLILQMLAQKPRFGTQVIEDANHRFGKVLHQGTVYPVFKALQSAGLVTRTDVPMEHGGRPRAYFALTDAGRAQATADKKVFSGLARAQVAAET